VVTAVLLIAFRALLRITVRFVEARDGIVLAAPVLGSFAPIDLNLLIFVLEYGSVVLGLYDKQGRLIHIGQAGSGFDQKTLGAVWQLLQKIKSKRSSFYGEVDALRAVHWVKPELVAEIKFSEWTHETPDGGQKLRAPVFLGLREDKDPKECVFEQ